MIVATIDSIKAAVLVLFSVGFYERPFPSRHELAGRSQLFGIVVGFYAVRLESHTDCLWAPTTDSPAGGFRSFVSLIDGVYPDGLCIAQWLGRRGGGRVVEFIIASDHYLERGVAATYLPRLLVYAGLTVLRLASGRPGGGDIEYGDEVMLSRAFEG